MGLNHIVFPDSLEVLKIEESLTSKKKYASITNFEITEHFVEKAVSVAFERAEAIDTGMR